MGRDKALLPGQFRYLVDDVAESVKAAAGNVTLIGDTQRYQELHYPCIPDCRPGFGPLSGLEAALSSTSSDLNLILACDMPAIEPAHLRSLVDRARASNAGCVAIQDVSGKAHPLCAVYRKQCLPVIQCRLNEKHLALMGLLDEVRTEYLLVDTVIPNINTPEQWTRWTTMEHKGRRAGWQTLT
ncbi:MAG: molybdenum cofactor guanylyltransferase [Bryobacteraceae bacterium]